ncbi:hypothetical protein [Vibrio sp. AND4]|uniref:hypothetical protein n=1 Tax=Vibrio sp. AND4 TaxID=314289 RepID=UPI00015F2C14|nr:hypothetical protein [Vibrio sp. AND4]EDP57971.1 hypothetical protein AND4_05354 [Vibrio sp. AND4]
MESNDSPTLESYIETFWQQAQQTLQDVSGQTWTDTSEHDPGVTLLEGVTARAAELAHLQTRPINDILVKEDQSGPVKVFPVDFEPQKVLTCGPVTVDDYRKVLLDLHSHDECFNDEFEQAFFFFSDVYITKEPVDKRYKYYFDCEKHKFTFRAGATSDKAYTLLGNYSLYLVPSEVLQKNSDLLTSAKQALLQYLPTIENVGEKFSNIHWLAEDVKQLELMIEVTDDINPADKQRIAEIYAEIYQVAKDFACPPVERYSTQELRRQGFTNNEIYRGPFLTHGWIAELPSKRDYTASQSFHMSHLLAKVCAINGVKKIIDVDSPVLEFTVNELKYLTFGHSITAVLQNVSLRTKSQVVLDKKIDDIKEYVSLPPLINHVDEQTVWGENSNDVSNEAVTKLLPDCYDLTSPTPSDSTKYLHQFLLPIEQTLANRNAQLNNLPNILGFDQTSREDNADFWGYQWPFEDGSSSDQVHDGYKGQLEGFCQTQNEDFQKSISSLQYLMSYFNEELGPNILLKPKESYLTSQRELLANIPKNQYYRAAYKNIEERIAGKIGMNADDIAIIETRRALPNLPAANSFNAHEVNNPSEEGDRLRLTLNNGSSDFQRGMLLDLSFQVPGLSEESTYPILCLMVDEVIDNDLFIKIKDTPLMNYVDDIIDSDSVKVSASDTFLADVPFRLQEPKDQSGNECQVTCVDFPALAQIGDTLKRFSKDSNTAITDHAYKITDIDRYQHKVTLEGVNEHDIQEQWFWYLEQDDMSERFSFTLSIALNKEMLPSYVREQWAEVEGWIKEILHSDLPSHCQVIIHWVERAKFSQLRETVNDWVKDGCPIGNKSYQILDSLTLGRAPSQMEGIGFSFIVKDDQFAAIEAEPDETAKQAYIDENDLLQVKPDSQS